MPDKLEKLKHILALANEDYLKYPDFLKFLSAMKVVLEEIRKDTKQYASSEIVQFTDKLNSLVDSVRVESKKQSDVEVEFAKLKREINSLFEAVENIPKPEKCEHKDVDVEELTNSILSKVPKEKPYELDVEALIGEVNALPDDDSLKIDASHIKNLPKPTQQVVGGSVRNINNLVQAGTNVTLSGSGVVSDPYIISSSGEGGGGAVDSVFGRTGVVTAESGDYTTDIVADSTDKRYVTDAQLTVLGNTSGTNTGDQNLSGYATLTGSETLTNKTLTSPILNTATVGTSLLPTTNDGAALGSTANSFSDLFLASGGVLNWNSGNATITHSAGVLTSNVPIQMPYIGVGGTPNSSTGLLVSGTGYTSNLIAATGSLSPTAGTNATLYRIAGTIVEASSGTHNLMSAMFLGTTTVTVGAATVNNTAGLYIEGAMTATVVGENYAIWSDDGINRFDGEVRMGGALNHDGTTVGFYGVTPVVRSSAYTVTNATTDRTYDANATTVDELADVLATLLADLKLTGIIA